MLHDFLLYTFVLATLIQLFYWLFIFSRLAFYKEKKYTKQSNNQPIPISIIICARNEAENLKQNLPRILNQTYRFLEIIVVNHNSSDKTWEILVEFQKKVPTLRIINLSNNKKIGKKHALSEGIKAATHQILLLTDADCMPYSKDWAMEMQQVIRDDIQIGLGYGPYTTYPGFLNKFIRFETVYTAIQYLSFALIGQSYMGVGRNLIYRKELFYQANGFHEHEHIASGDDDLFINQVARKNNVRVILNRQAFVYSEPKKSWRTFFYQKSRHLSTASAYQRHHQILLGLLSASHFWHYASGIVLLILSSNDAVVLLLYLVRLCIVWLLYGLILKRFHEHILLLWIPVLDAVFVLYYVLFTPALFTRNTNQWKS